MTVSINVKTQLPTGIALAGGAWLAGSRSWPGRAPSRSPSWLSATESVSSARTHCNQRPQRASFFTLELAYNREAF